MEERSAFPGWLNRLWWVLLPGVLLLATTVLWWTGHLGVMASEQRATGLAAVAGGFAETAVVLLVGWLLVSLALMHLWLLVAAGFAVQRRVRLQRRERWKLLGTGLALLAVYSPLIAVIVVRMFVGFGEG